MKNETEKITDYNGIEIPTNVKSSKINIQVTVEYIGKYGTPEQHTIEDCNLDEWNGIDDALRTFEIDYKEIL